MTNVIETLSMREAMDRYDRCSHCEYVEGFIHLIGPRCVFNGVAYPFEIGSVTVDVLETGLMGWSDYDDILLIRTTDGERIICVMARLSPDY